jgi:hypothetical protein
MILNIKGQFCIQFDTDEELERDEVFYRNHNIKFFKKRATPIGIAL